MHPALNRNGTLDVHVYGSFLPRTCNAFQKKSKSLDVFQNDVAFCADGPFTWEYSALKLIFMPPRLVC